MRRLPSFLLFLSYAAAAAAAEPPVPPDSPAPALLALFPAAPTVLDPQRTAAVGDYWYLDNVFEPLFRHAADGTLVPYLGLDWAAAGEETWIVRLREGVRFHDGELFTSADVVATIRRAASLPGSRFTSVAALEEVEALDPLRVRFRTRLRPPEWLTLLTFLRIVPAASPERIVEPVGTGPYRLRADAAPARYALEAFAGYWGSRPPIAAIHVAVEADGEERARRLLAGDVDFVAGLPGSQVSAIEATRRSWVATSIGTAVAALVLSPCEPPFDDSRVREAIDLAIDRGRIVERLQHLAQASGQLLTPAMLGFDPTLDPVAADPSRARQLLAEAGKGRGLDLEMILNPRAGGVAAEVAEQLSAIGVRATLREVAGDAILGLAATHQGAAFLTFQSGSPGDSLAYLMWRLHSPDAARGIGGGNLCHCPHAELDRTLEVAALADDPTERAARVAEASRLARERRSHLPLVWGVDLFGLRRGLDWVPRVDDLVLFAEMSRAE